MDFQTLQIPARPGGRSSSPLPPRSRQAAHRIGVLAVLSLVLLIACGKSPGSRDPNEPPHPDAPADISYSTGVILATPDVAIDPIVPSVTGAVSLWSVSPDLPTGLALDTQSGEISGTLVGPIRTAVYTIFAHNSFGVGQANLSVQAIGKPRFAYTANLGDNTISMFTSDEESNRLRHYGYYAQTEPETAPTDVRVDPQGRLLYSVNSFALTPYAIDPDTGRLTTGVAKSIGSGPHSLYVHPSGDFLFLTTSTKDRLRVYSVDPEGENGEFISQLEDYETLAKPTKLVGDPNGRYLFVLHNGTGKILSFTIDQESGAVTEQDLQDPSEAAGGEIHTPSAAMDPRGESLYVIFRGVFNAILRYKVNTTDATLTNGQLKDGLVETLTDVVVDPTGRYLYLLRGGENTAVYPIEFETGALGEQTLLEDTGGTLSLRFTQDGTLAHSIQSAAQLARVHTVDPSTGLFTDLPAVRARKNPRSLAVVHGMEGIGVTATKLYVVNKGNDSVTAFTIDPDTGAIDDQGAIAAPTGIAPADIAVDPRGRFLYAANSVSGDVTVFAIGADGSLTDNDTLYTFDDDGPVAVEVEPSGRFVYLALPVAAQVVQLSVGEDGTLSTPVEQEIADTPDSLTIDLTGRFLYVADGDDEIIQVFTIDPLTGALAPLGDPLEAIGYPTRLEFASGGARAYSTLRATNRVQAFDVGGNGALGTITADIETASEPNDIVFTPDGQFAYVATMDTAGQGAILLYDVNPETGELYDSIGGGLTWRWLFLAGTGPRDLDVSTDGSFLYVLSGGSEDVRVFTIDPAEGILTWLPPARQPGLVPLRMRMLYTVE